MIDNLQNRILAALGSQPDIRLFRNQVGFGYVGRVFQRDHKRITISPYRPVSFGLHVGSSDLIGWQVRRVTPAMVGQSLAIFFGVEVKDGNDREKPHQRVWRDAVNRMGGVAIVARTDDLQTLRSQIQEARP